MTAVTAAAPSPQHRRDWLPPTLVVVVAVAIAHWAAVPYTVGVFHDDGIYALLARSIAAGDGFHHSHLPGAPAATHYPPLYPLLLAIVWRLGPAFPLNVPLLLGVNALFVGAAGYGWWRFATSRLAWPTGRAAVGALVATLAVPVLVLAGALLSETFFLALLWPALLVCERVIDTPGNRRAFGAGVLVGTLMLVRTHAVALLVALLFVLATRSRWRSAFAVGSAATLTQLPWLLWSRSATPKVEGPLEGAYGSYLSWVSAGFRDGGAHFALGTISLNARECWLLLQDRFATGLPAPAHFVTLLLALSAMAAGAWSLKHRAPVTIVFVALYVGIVLLFPYTPWRYVWIVWPLAAMLVMEGVRSLWGPPRWRRLAVAVCAVWLALATLRTELHEFATRAWRTPARMAGAQIAPVVAWVKAHTLAHEVVLTEGEQVIALYAERQAAPPVTVTALEYVEPPRISDNVARLGAMLAAVPARYVILLESPAIQAAGRLATHHPGLRPLASLSTGVVYEVVK